MIKIKFKIQSFFKRIWNDIKNTFSRKNIIWAVMSGCAILSMLGIYFGIMSLILLG